MFNSSSSSFNARCTSPPLRSARRRAWVGASRPRRFFVYSQCHAMFRLLAGRVCFGAGGCMFVSVLAGACQFGTARAGSRRIHHHRLLAIPPGGWGEPHAAIAAASSNFERQWRVMSRLRISSMAKRGAPNLRRESLRKGQLQPQPGSRFHEPVLDFDGMPFVIHHAQLEGS